MIIDWLTPVVRGTEAQPEYALGFMIAWPSTGTATVVAFTNLGEIIAIGVNVHIDFGVHVHIGKGH